jgi:miniconductance mechanosensitive channel
MIGKYKNIELIKPYLEHRKKENDSFNKKNVNDKSLLINGKNQTNLGVFRTYADAFLHENPHINKDMYLMVRYLQPTDRGIPLEIFCFCYDKVWQNYEKIQADIIDHLIASVTYFDLDIFELPSGKDFSDL